MLANIIPYAWRDDPKVERHEMQGMCDALQGVEKALGIKYDSNGMRIYPTTGQSP